MLSLQLISTVSKLTFNSKNCLINIKSKFGHKQSLRESAKLHNYSSVNTYTIWVQNAMFLKWPTRHKWLYGYDNRPHKVVTLRYICSTSVEPIPSNIFLNISWFHHSFTQTNKLTEEVNVKPNAAHKEFNVSPSRAARTRTAFSVDEDRDIGRWAQGLCVTSVPFLITLCF